MDEIRVKNLEVFCHHGVYKEENVIFNIFFRHYIVSPFSKAYTIIQKMLKT